LLRKYKVFVANDDAADYLFMRTIKPSAGFLYLIFVE